MLYVCLNPRLLDTKGKMLDFLKESFGFPPDCGANLDALNDMLTASFEPASVLCLRFVRDGAILYPHAEGVFRVLRDATLQNPALRVDIQDLPAL